MKKPLPQNTLNDLRPPHKNYKAFENWQSNPFNYDADGFEMVNAWWLAEASLLAYGNEDFVNEKFTEAGLTTAGFKVQSFSEHNIEFFVAHNDNFIIAAFRGTEIDNFKGFAKDLRSDALAVPVPNEGVGWVHHGFKEAISIVWEPLKNHLSSIQSDGKTRTIWLAGHSLGAAIATLAAERIIRIMKLKVNGLYTIGSPRVGNSEFAERLSTAGLSARTYRFVNNSDVIAKVPTGPYNHVGSLKLIDSQGHIQNVDDASQIADAARFTFIESVRRTFRSLLNAVGITNDVPDYLADHAPIYYAIHIWNSYDGTQQ